MKRFLVVLLACLLACGTASANSWGLSGGLLDVVSSTDDYDDYVALCQLKLDGRHLAVMSSRYHHVLMMAAKGADGHYTMAVNNTRAVYQPESDRDDCCLNETAEGFTLSYAGESYEFVQGLSCFYPDEYCLRRAQIGSLTLEANVSFFDNDSYCSGYMASDADGTAAWAIGEIRLADFNISLMPRSTAEIRHMNRVSNAFGADYGAFSIVARRVEHAGKKTIPVYSAPDKNSWRSGNGKAAVSLHGSVDVLTSSEGWHFIRYEVSPRTSRIGYVQTDALGNARDSDVFYHVPAAAARSSFITDDPDVSQFHQAKIPAGTTLTGLGVYDAFYAYVETSIDGKTARGFMPLRDIELPQDDILPDVMAQAAGAWAFSGGGNVSDDHMILCSDGSYTGCTYNGDVVTDILTRPPTAEEIGAACCGTWEVTRNDPARRIYWDQAPYVLLIREDNGRVRSYGMSLDGNEMGLQIGEGGGSYTRVE